jgi:hypothetical protein
MGNVAPFAPYSTRSTTLAEAVARLGDGWLTARHRLLRDLGEWGDSERHIIAAELLTRRAARRERLDALAESATIPASDCGLPSTLSPFDTVATPHGLTSTPRGPAPRLCVA